MSRSPIRTALAAAVLLAAPMPAASQPAPEPEWHAAPEADVLLRPWAYEPRSIHLAAGQPVKLRFVNDGHATLTFRAPAFFAAARVRSGDADVVARGAIRLAPGERRTIALVPRAGRYPLSSSNLIHRLLGMHGEIVVE